jgi:hypothetical protein
MSAIEPAQAAPASIGEARRDAPPVFIPGTAPPTVKPMVLRDDTSGVLFYFESDGQHITAIGRDGRILWHRNPVEEAGLKGIAKDGKAIWPAIHYAGPPQDWMIKAMQAQGKTGAYIAISLNTKDFGLVDRQNGAFTFMGRD